HAGESPTCTLVARPSLLSDAGHRTMFGQHRSPWTSGGNSGGALSKFRLALLVNTIQRPRMKFIISWGGGFVVRCKQFAPAGLVFDKPVLHCLLGEHAHVALYCFGLSHYPHSCRKMLRREL